jgi:hypothetical protein
MYIIDNKKYSIHLNKFMHTQTSQKKIVSVRICELSPRQTITFRIYERQHNLSNVCILPEEKKENESNPKTKTKYASMIKTHSLEKKRKNGIKDNILSKKQAHIRKRSENGVIADSI